MSTRSQGIYARPIAETPIAVLDFETTGLAPGLDRVVEVSLVRREPQASPSLVLNTLVNPQRHVAATEIHGITDEDVADAPVFAEIGAALLQALSGCVLASYNIYFDLAFLEYELSQIGVRDSPPHFCLMYLRPMLGLGNRCTLETACQSYGIPHSVTHVSAADSMAAARLLEIYLREMQQKGIATFEDLSRLKKYKFTTSFARDPLSRDPRSPARQAAKVKSRSETRGKPQLSSQIASTSVSSAAALGSYWDQLEMFLSDLEITEQEFCELEERRRTLGLKDEQVRVLHARAFSSALLRYTTDEWLDEVETLKLRLLYRCLHRLGWAPGE